MACFADTSQSQLAYGVQVDADTQQTVLTDLRNTNSSLQFTAESVQSNEIRADRNVSDIIRTQSSTAGDVGFELSYATYDDFIEGALSSAFTGTGTTVDPYVAVNSTTKKHFTFERKFETGATDAYEQFMACEVDTLSLNMAASEIVTGSLSFMGINSTQSTTSVDGDGYTAANTNRVYNAVNMVTSVLEGGVEYKSNIQSLTIDIANNKRESRAIGSEAPSCIGDGQFVVTGQMTVYFKDNTVYDKFLNQTLTSVKLSLQDDAGTVGNQIIIDMPSVLYTNVAREIPGNNEDVLVVLDYQAIYNAGIGGTMQWTQIDADA